MGNPIQNLPETSPADKTVAVLAVSQYKEDCSCLRAIFSHSNWRISTVASCQDAIRFLNSNRMAVLICECQLPDGTWKDLLEQLSRLPQPPLLVVAARQADDSLWAEVLNLGAYDVLSKPFDRSEVTRIISLAWLQWRQQSEHLWQKPTASSTASGSSRSLPASA